MSSPTFRRNSCRGVVCGNRASSECHVRRRGSSCSYYSSGAQTEGLSVSLSQPIFNITLRFLLAIDLWLSKRIGVCACEESSWGSIRPLVRLVEFSGHVIPWLIGTVYSLLRGESAEEQEIMLNLALGEQIVAVFWNYYLDNQMFLQWRYMWISATKLNIYLYFIYSSLFFLKLPSSLDNQIIHFILCAHLFYNKISNIYTSPCIWHANLENFTLLKNTSLFVKSISLYATVLYGMR